MTKQEKLYALSEYYNKMYGKSEGIYGLTGSLSAIITDEQLDLLLKVKELNK